MSYTVVFSLTRADMYNLVLRLAHVAKYLLSPEVDKTSNYSTNGKLDYSVGLSIQMKHSSFALNVWCTFDSGSNYVWDAVNLMLREKKSELHICPRDEKLRFSLTTIIS